MSIGALLLQAKYRGLRQQLYKPMPRAESRLTATILIYPGKTGPNSHV